MYLVPKKSLGQHFLTDKNVAAKIISALQASNCNTIVEIGPGQGILTDYLLQRIDKQIVLIEIDRRATEHLQHRFADKSFRLLNENFLQCDLTSVVIPPIALIGNLPYNISSPIFFKILDNKDLIPEVVCMVQKEVAERIASAPGTKSYGILSVLLQTFYSADYLFGVGKKVFAPPPDVLSAVIRLRRNDRSSLPCPEKQFRRIVKAVFNQRRKMLRNSLQSIGIYLPSNSPFLTKRPEQLGVEDFIEIARTAQDADTK